MANLLNRYPSIEELRRRAKERIPYFAWEYIDSGTGADECVRRNRAALDHYASAAIYEGRVRTPTNNAPV